MGRVVVALFAGIVGISFAALFVRWALPAPPVVTAFYRMLFATALLAAWLLTTRETLPAWPSTRLALAAGLCFGTDLALWHTAIVRTSLANATLLVNTTPIFVGFYAWSALGEAPGRRFAAAAALALAGAALLLGSGSRIATANADARSGDLLAVAAALFYSGYLLLMKAARRDGHTLPVLTIASGGAAAMLGVYAAALGDRFTGFPTHSWVAMIGAAVVAQIGGVLGIVWALRWARATFASVALLAQPVGTTLLAWWLLGESISGIQALGGAAVLAAIALASGRALDPD